MNILKEKELYFLEEFKLRDKRQYRNFFIGSHVRLSFVKFNLMNNINYYEISESIYFINGFIFLVTLIQDTNNEPYNKRVQGRPFLEARDLGINMLAIYPIFEKNKIIDYIYVIWTNAELSKYKGNTNPAAKVSVKIIYNMYTKEIVGINQNSTFKYKSEIYTYSQFWNIIMNL